MRSVYRDAGAGLYRVLARVTLAGCGETTGMVSVLAECAASEGPRSTAARRPRGRKEARLLYLAATPRWSFTAFWLYFAERLNHFTFYVSPFTGGKLRQGIVLHDRARR